MMSSTWTRHFSPSSLTSSKPKSKLPWPLSSSSKKVVQEGVNQEEQTEVMKQQDIEEAANPVSGNRPSIGDPYHRKSTAALHLDEDHNSNSSELPLVDTTTRTATTRSVNKASEPRLLHPILQKIPLHLRFGFNGLLTNVLFMVVYNSALSMFEDRVAVSTIYSVVYLFFIPLGHAFVSLLVFGWPEKYIASLASNFPIGLTAIAIGGLLTGYLDSIDFSDMVDDYLRDNFTFSRMPPRVTGDKDVDNMKNEFWSSLLVLIVTSLWTYILSIYVNSSPTKSEKKEL